LLPRENEFFDWARALFKADAEPLRQEKRVRQVKGLRMRDGSIEGLRSWYFEDPRLEALQRQVCEAEIEQALDRLRLMGPPPVSDCGGTVVVQAEGTPVEYGPPKLVWLATDVVPDVTVDAVVTLDEAVALERIRRVVEARGFVPLSDRAAAALLPDVWKTREAARNDQGLKLLRDQPEVTAAVLPHCRFVEARKAAQRGKATPFLVAEGHELPCGWVEN
jgi:hypothetical protein